jgi:cytochrome P450 family 107 subfamily K polypeptide 1
VTVICEMLGIPPEDRETIQPWTKTLVAASSAEMPAQTRAHVHAFIVYLRELFERKRRHPTGDMVSTLVHAEENGDMLDEHELLSMVFLLFIAGYVTTMNLIGNGILALLIHPDQRALVDADPALVKGLVEETLRFWGPVDNLTRTATQDVEIGGTLIRRGEPVMVSLASADRDPMRFAKPDMFDITRPDASRHIAFGKGMHLCLGAQLARMEAQVAFATLLQRYPRLRLALAASDLVWRPDFLRGLERLPVLF